MKHPGHTYGGFVSAISERGMTGNEGMDSLLECLVPVVPGFLLLCPIVVGA
jgi:hypothetical protein